MRKHFSIGALSALAAALCVAQSAHADTVTFDDIPVTPANSQQATNDFYDGGLHFNQMAFAIMPKGLDPTPIGQTSPYLEAGSSPGAPQSVLITHYTGQAPGNFTDGDNPAAPAGADYADPLSFNFWFLRMGLGGGNTGLVDQVTISGVRASDCVGCSNPVSVTFGVTSTFQLFSLTDFTDLASLTISEQFISPNVRDTGWLALDDLGYTPYVAGGDNTAPPIPEPSAWALMILGFGGVGALVRRNRRMGLATA
jgi:hypothetical protein